jgi:hypothetical protein
MFRFLFFSFSWAALAEVNKKYLQPGVSKSAADTVKAI